MDHLGREGGILSQLAGGRVVVCVRYLLSSYAQQWDQVDWTWLRQINAPCRRPDLTLFIDTPVEGAPNARWLRDRYLGAIERLRDEGERIVAVDRGGTADEIQRACQREVILALERTV
jgi:dTMP kinase